MTGARVTSSSSSSSAAATLAGGRLERLDGGAGAHLAGTGGGA